MASSRASSSKSLQPFAGVAGHVGVLSSAEGEILVKPCTQAEVDFYQDTLLNHADFSGYIPTFMGTLTLSDAKEDNPTGEPSDFETVYRALQQQGSHKAAAETAIVLENLEHGFTKPNVIDLKLGSKLYAPGTKADKAARLDKVASETTSGSLNFRIAGMRVWNSISNDYDVYDKQYGRKFDATTVSAGFKTFFADLLSSSERREFGEQIIAAMLEEIVAIRTLLQQNESRSYSSSVLIVFEGEWTALHRKAVAMHEQQQNPPTHDADAADADDVEGKETEDSTNSEALFKLKMIDFAHSKWLPGQGQDDNIITGLMNIEKQLELLLSTDPA